MELGERGINLSGGQKARVGLARACYANSSIVLLDDVLAAVDSHVGDHIFEHCVLGLLGKEEKRTRVFATNQLHRLQHADLILFVQDRQIAAQSRKGVNVLMQENEAFRDMILRSGLSTAEHKEKEDSGGTKSSERL